jgi:hypothetical protein
MCAAITKRTDISSAAVEVTVPEVTCCRRLLGPAVAAGPKRLTPFPQFEASSGPGPSI